MSDLDIQVEVVSTEEAENIVGSVSRGRTSRYEPIAQKWTEIDQDKEAIVLEALTKNDIQNLRNLLYRRFGKESILVRSAKTGEKIDSEEPEYKAVVRTRENGEYLRDD